MSSPPTERAPWTRAVQRAGRFLLALPRPVAWLLPLGWMGLIWALSSQRIAAPGGAFGLWGFLGNLAHAPLFGLLALFWLALVLRPAAGEPWPRASARQAALVLALVVGYGVVDEWHQSLTGGRQSSARDVLTDLVGASCVLWVASYVGSAGAGERGLRRRLLAGVALCSLAAAVALLPVAA